MYVGFNSMWAPVVRMADVLPFLGNLMGLGANWASGIAAAILSGIVIALSWLRHRPLFSAAILFAIVAGVWMVKSPAKSQGGSSAGSLVECLRACNELKDERELFDKCTNTCTAKF